MEEVTALWKGEINEFEETIDHLKELAEELPDTFQKFDRFEDGEKVSLIRSLAENLMVDLGLEF